MIGFPLQLPIDSGLPRHIELCASMEPRPQGAFGGARTVRKLEIEITSIEEWRALAAWLDQRPVALRLPAHLPVAS